MPLDANVLATAIKDALGYRAETDPAVTPHRSVRSFVEQASEASLPADYEREHPDQYRAAVLEREASINALASAIAHGVAEALVARLTSDAEVYFEDSSHPNGRIR